MNRLRTEGLPLPGTKKEQIDESFLIVHKEVQYLYGEKKEVHLKGALKISVVQNAQKIIDVKWHCNKSSCFTPASQLHPPAVISLETPSHNFLIHSES